MAEHKAQLDLVCLRNAIRKNDKAICSEIEQRYRAYLPQTCKFSTTFNPHTQRQDGWASNLLPTDVPEKRIPVQVKADGNCLYNAGSVSLTGDEKLSTTLRLLTAAELYLHSDFYASHPR